MKKKLSVVLSKTKFKDAPIVEIAANPDPEKGEKPIGMLINLSLLYMSNIMKLWFF